ncbi:MAG: hypothetical protein EWV75_12755 [Microcystis wesenbergii Mw_QC_S_20081001_S30D]|uniref:Uncharacterized protein n=1 Tax=Microcystis wesenbergii Mw_QC_S_20081001_S30D TaxID=2486245 RepID=A0A552JJH9_9CHRO|nr:hypothetical protein [Microcystis aeruginosa W11-03]NCR93334.1 hypothetical protein [Microcystis aeruginosa W11-06]TRU95882.1 MAG: hypothetical protein EWV75_12755 [Microcystis wesenbergii Mw_QC_S_20081001_S30D]TRV05027.1 MAG: hypothetical protein EWV73_01305 [Microcystis wesenbergii Mw_QC_B_20070930_S4D]
MSNMARKGKNGAVTAVGGLGALVGFGCMIVGNIWSVRIVFDEWGVPMGAISILMLPATLAIMPWYASLVLGNWWLLALIWGGGLLVSIGSDMAKD